MQGIAKTSQLRNSDTSETEPSHQQAILRDRLNLLFSAVSLAQLMAVFVAYILYSVHTDHHVSTLAPDWLWLAVITFSVRGTLGILYRYSPTILPSHNAWLLVYRIAAVSAGIVWGLTGFVFFPPDNQTLQILTLLVLAGVSAGALSSTASDYLSFALFMGLSLTPTVIIGLMGEADLQQELGILTAILMVLLFKTGKIYAQSIDNSFKLRYENADLVSDLEREKTRVIKDAETMVGTILACAPIAIWTTDNDGVINLIDGNQLPVDPKLSRPKVGDNIFEIFEKNTQIAKETRRALNGESFSSELESRQHAYEMHYSPFIDADGDQQGMIGVAIDISERKRHEIELSYRADYDQLTGLSNRNLIINQIEHAFTLARRQKKLVAIYFIDLDNFKTINDTMGHQVGDDLLCQVASRLRAILRESDIPARLGGDEFLVMAENLNKVSDAETVANKISGIFDSPFKLDDREIFVTSSIGISVFPHDGESAEKLLQSSDTAMYHAKEIGKSNYRFFTREMQQAAERHLEIETELRKALDNGEIFLVYQPKIDVRSNEIYGAEVLMRWTSEKLGRVPPDEFIPIAEIAGLMPKLGNWVLSQACQEAAKWASLRPTPVQIAINISPPQFRATDLLQQVKDSLKESGLDANLLELEITESLLVQDAPETLKIFDELVKNGISLALDDFGTGYSSLSYLKKFPMQVLKIDRSFISDLGKDYESEILVEAIIGMAHSLKLEVVAEGVETAEQLAFLKERGIDLIQGYYFSPPVDEETFRNMLRNNSTSEQPISETIHFL